MNICRIAEAVNNEMKNKITERGLGFRFEPSANPVYVFSSEKIISQILINLLDNAMKFTDKGEISVKINSYMLDEENFAEIIVSDTGIGISGDNIDVIFKEFRQVSEGLSRSYEGVGLGLTLVKKLVEALGGRVFVNSEPGKGSSFIIRIPAVHGAKKTQTDETLSRVENKSRPIVKPKELPVVLLVEDNLINIEVIDVFLMEFCKVEYVRTGKEALEKVKTKKYPLILMDINLGMGIDGVETVKAIRDINSYKSIPIVAITGYAMESDKEKFLGAGFTHYLSKPFDKKDIISLVEEIFINEGFYK